MSKLSLTRRGVLVTTLVLAAVGCSDTDENQHQAGPSTSTSSAPTPSTSTSSTSSTEPPDESASVRCTDEPGPGIDVTIRTMGSRITAAELGRGGTWAVMLHQTDGGGFCGWWPYATWLSGRGVHVLMIDLCGYGRSECTDDLSADQPAQAVRAVAWARDHGAQRVTLVGASMGGAVAMAAADTAKVDAVVDLSGPPDWTGTDLVADAGDLTIPTLLAVSPTDAAFIPIYRRALPQIRSSDKRLVIYQGGHGYQMLGYETQWSDLAKAVSGWIGGKYND